MLAAGAGTRFGGPKQLAALDGRPLLEHVLRAAEAVPGLDPLVVVLGAHAEKIRTGVDLGRFEAVVAPDWAEGQSASLHTGVRSCNLACRVSLPAGSETRHVRLQDLTPLLVLLGDQPRITPAAIAAVLGDGSLPGGVAARRATYGGVPGHPVLIGAALAARVGELRGDAGFRSLLERERIEPVEVGHLCDPADVDTPEELETLQR